jgi:ABC-2 type transport system ATP-binding protein
MRSEPVVQVQALVKRYGTKTAVDGLDLVARAGVTAVLGPNGAGKTTTVETCEGYRRPDSGTVRVLGLDPVAHSAALRPRIGVMLQSGGVYSGARADEMLRHVARLHAHPLDVDALIERLGLGSCGRTSYRRLSGGQQQRLALARALVMEPALLLLDEPLSNLDAKLREDMRFELKRLQRELGLTCVYVTHDQTEALAMSNQVAVMRDGKVEQVGRPRDIYEAPRTRFVADFIGTSNFIDGIVEETRPGGYLVRTVQGRLEVPSELQHAAGDEVVVSARPEHIALTTELNGGGPNRWRGRVGARAFLGEVVDHVVAVGETEIRVRCNSTISIPPETDVTLVFNQEALTLIPAGE